MWDALSAVGYCPQRDMPSVIERGLPGSRASSELPAAAGFSAEQSRYDRMLAHMFGISGDGLHDRLTEFSLPVTGGYYFAPSLNVLNALAG
jgi:deferrochelatase/peroxidase EfeB